MSERKPHHHGNLREALIDAGIALLETGGLPALTLRAAAARAGVSHAAPAHHFKGKDGLLAAVAARGYATFTRCMEEDRAHAGPDPRERLVGICRGYLRFAEEHGALFELIFATDFKAGTRDLSDPDLAAASEAAFAMLVETCAPFEPSPAGPLVKELTVWSCVHGFASLRRFHRLRGPADGAAPDIADILPHLPLRREAS